MESFRNIIEKEIIVGTGITIFKAIRDHGHNIVDLEWVFYGSINNSELKSDALKGKHLLIECQGQFTRALFEKYVQVILTGVPMEFVQHRDVNGGLWYKIAAVKKDDGVIVTCFDITELKRREEVQLANEETFEVIIENSTEWIIRNNLKGEFLYASPSGERIFGYSFEDLKHKTFLDILINDEVPRLIEVYETFRKEPKQITLQLKIRTKSGRSKWCEAISKPIFGQHNKLVAVQSSIRDITERKRIENELLNSERQYRFLTEYSGDWIFKTDSGHRLTYSSPAVIQMTGYEQEDVLGMYLIDFLHPDDQQKIVRAYQMIGDEKPLVESFRFLSKDKGYRWLEVKQVPVKGKNGELLELLLTARDITDRKEVEEELHRLNLDLEKRVASRTRELQRREQLLQLIIDAIPALISYLDADMKFKIVNKAFYQWFEETIKKYWEVPFNKIVESEFRAEDVRAFADVVAGEKDHFLHVVKDDLGRIRHLRSSLIRDIDESGSVVGYVTISIDLTEEMQERNKAQEAHRRFVSVVNNVPVVFWGVDKKGMITISEGKALKKLGLQPGEQVGVSAYELYAKYPDIIQNIERALSGEEFNVSMQVSDIYFQSFYAPIKDRAGEVKGMAGISSDISDRIKAEKALLASEAKYKAMAEGLPQMIWTADPDGEIDYYNQNWKIYTGQVNADIMVGWKEVVHPQDIGYSIRKWNHALNTGEALDNEARFKRAADGSYRWHLVRAWPVKDGEGHIIKWVGTGTDIHDQKMHNQELNIKNQELVKTNKDLDNFVYTASHDLKAPISNLEGLLNAISNDISPLCGKDLNTMLHMSQDSLKRLKLIISELTEISQIQRNLEEDHDQIDIGGEIELFKNENQNLIEEAKVTITTDLKVASLTYSKRNFRSILFNLLSNAIQYRCPGRAPVIHICTGLKDENCMHMFIKDNGLGFEIEQKAKVFGMFKRLHTHVEGTGVGLYMVKRILENNGGKIDVESTIGRGTTFKIYFKL